MNAVYMMAGGQHGTLYIGVTSELLKRIAQHREGQIEGFTKRYGVNAWSGSNSTTASSLRSSAKNL